MRHDLREWGVDIKFRRGGRGELSRVYDRCVEVREAYLNILDWHDIGGELNHWLHPDRIDVLVSHISEKLLKHAYNSPDDIGKK